MSAISSSLERSIQRYGDDLYRLALLLTPDQTSAARSLLAAARQLAASSAAINESVLIAALLAALPKEPASRRPRRPPAWAQPPAQYAELAPLLLALAQLPRDQRLALGLMMLRAYEPAQIAPLLGSDELSVREHIRDALLALAPAAGHETTILDPRDAPEECRPTRAALALGDERQHHDPALRGHLALCSACRAADQAWSKLTSQAEAALRGALRDVRLTSALLAQLQIAAQPIQATAGARLLANQRIRIALVALPVLLLITWLVWPRATRQAGADGDESATAGLPPAPIELVRRAEAQLYLPAAGEGVWHSTYAIKWRFADNSSAPLTANQWIDPATGRHRLQLVHQDGGGPYEYELADRPGSVWYAVSPNYRPSLYLLNPHEFPGHLHLRASDQQRDQMLQARLQSGPWGLPAKYLRQAETAELRAWGRQRDADGRLIDLISFAGISPLALAPDAPAATTSQVTVLLAIDERNGRLREVRELFGAPGSEQTTRTIWRVVAEQWISDPLASNQIFDHDLAWNGVGKFQERETLASPAFPLINQQQLVSLARGIQAIKPGIQMLAAPPPATSLALLLRAGDTASDGGVEKLTFVYLGAGRQLEFFTSFADLAGPALVGGEVIDLDGRQAILLASAGQRYQAQINLPSNNGGPPPVVRVSALGYTRAELLAVLRALGPASLAAYRAQAALFTDQFARNNAFAALLGALEPDPPAGFVRHTVERLFSRQASRADPWSDPYHRLPYSGLPEQLVREAWARSSAVSGRLELSATVRAEDQTILGRQYVGAEQSWYQNLRSNEIIDFPTSAPAQQLWDHPEQRLILNMLACGAGQAQVNADGTQTVFLSESDWQTQPCQYQKYSRVLQNQTSATPDMFDVSEPYVADLQESTLTTWVDLDLAGQAIRAEVRAGSRRAGTLLERWERVEHELRPAGDAPANTFDPAPPAALLHWDHTSLAASPAAPRAISIADAREFVETPLFALASPAAGNDPALGLTRAPLAIEAGAPASAPKQRILYDRSVFVSALNDGYALRLTCQLDNSAPPIELYQGAAARFGAYLHATASWQNSLPRKLQVGGRAIDSWQVTLNDQQNAWILFELDGTLIAANLPPDQLDATLAQLAPLPGQ